MVLDLSIQTTRAMHSTRRADNQTRDFGGATEFQFDPFAASTYTPLYSMPATPPLRPLSLSDLRTNSGLMRTAAEEPVRPPTVRRCDVTEVDRSIV